MRSILDRHDGLLGPRMLFEVRADQPAVVVNAPGFVRPTLVCPRDDLSAIPIGKDAILFEVGRIRRGTAVAPADTVGQLLPWRRRDEVPKRASNPNSPSTFLTVGAYAGRARFRRTGRGALTPSLERAIGQIVEVGYAGIAPRGEMFAGQALYLEWRSDEVLDGYLIPEQDLEFL